MTNLKFEKFKVWFWITNLRKITLFLPVSVVRFEIQFGFLEGSKIQCSILEHKIKIRGLEFQTLVPSRFKKLYILPLYSTGHLVC